MNEIGGRDEIEISLCLQHTFQDRFSPIEIGSIREVLSAEVEALPELHKLA
jgi:hypothetical protein